MRQVCEHAQPVGQVAGGLGLGEGVDEPRERAVVDEPSGFGRGDRQSYGQMRLPDAGQDSNTLPDTRAAGPRSTTPSTPMRVSPSR